MKCFFLVLVTLGTHTLLGQTDIKSLHVCDELQSVMVLANDMIHIKCDTAYVLNKLTFRKYDSAYGNLKRKGTGVASLINAYDGMVELQQNRLREISGSYDELRASFEILSGEAGARIADSSVRLAAATASLETLNRDLTETKRLLVEAKEIVEAEQGGLSLDRMLWGIGGFAAGIVMGVLVSR